MAPVRTSGLAATHSRSVGVIHGASIVTSSLGRLNPDSSFCAIEWCCIDC